MAFTLLCAMPACISVTGSVYVPRDDADTPLRHIVLIKFQADTPQAEKNRVMDELGDLEHEISEIAHFESGVDVSGRGLNKGFEHGGVFTFESRTDLDTYRAHPAHAAFVERATPVIDEIFVFDYYPDE